MLREIPNARQNPGDYPRRLFEDAQLDLCVWLDADGHPCGFQLCYDLQDAKALTWLPGRGFTHRHLDLGETNSYNNAAPILGDSLSANLSAITALFIAADAELPVEVRAFVREKLASASV